MKPMTSDSSLFLYNTPNYQRRDMKNPIRSIAVSAAIAAGLSLTTAASADPAAGKSGTVQESGKVTVLTEAMYKSTVEDFATEEWKYLGKIPAIVDFYADWCGPCRQMGPVLEEIAKEYAGKIVVYKVNVDEAQTLSRSYGIRSIPAFLLIPAEGEPQMAVGSMPKAEFKKRIEAALLK